MPAPSFRGAYSVTTDLTTYNFAACDLGTPNASRLVIVVVSGYGTNVCNSVTVDGVSATSVGTAVAVDNNRDSMWQAAAVANPTGQIDVVFAAGMFDCTIGVYALYPVNQTVVDYVTNTGSAATIVISNLEKINGGFTILHAHNAQSGRTAIITQNGAEIVVEDADAEVEALNSYCYAHHDNTASTTTEDYTVTWSAGGANASFTGASWGISVSDTGTVITVFSQMENIRIQNRLIGY